MVWNREELERHLEPKQVRSVYIDLQAKLMQLPPDGSIHDTLGGLIANLNILITAPDREPWITIKKESFGECRERSLKSYQTRIDIVLGIVNKYSLTV
ncbi:MAG: hypothetical protein ABIJ18_01590 [archaeon]